MQRVNITFSQQTFWYANVGKATLTKAVSL